MALYDYYCEKCNLNIEINKKISDDSIEYCSSCNLEMKRLISKANFVLAEGNVGWYKDGYSSKKVDNK
jgi:putative FmdB family regulatory protein